MTDRLEKLAEHYERQAMFYAPHLFNEYGVATGYAVNDPEHHREEVAYVANCFTIAAALRAAQEKESNNGK